jgi:hypothetical protein
VVRGQRSDRRRAGVAEDGLLALVGYAGLLAIVGYWTWRAVHDPLLKLFSDFNGFYMGGQVAWATGHPEHFASWTGTPVLALAMGLTSRLVSLNTGADLLELLNAAIVLVTVGIVLRRLRGVLSPAWWWIVAAALVSFGPIMSTVWWHQVNLIPLALALAGYDCLRRQRLQPAAALIGLSVAFKPLAILLPIVLLARRDTRRTGAWAVGYVVLFAYGCQALLAWHAHSASALSPLVALRNFDAKTGVARVSGFTQGWACYPSNFAPGSSLCRIAGTQHPTLQRCAALVFVALIGAWVMYALRGRDARSWEVFAFTCVISPMISPIDWAHYQVMLAPLLVLLVVRFTTGGATPLEWAGLAIAFVLASLNWGLYSSPIDVVRHGFWPGKEFYPTLLDDLESGAQYVLLLTGTLWYWRRQPATRSTPALTSKSSEPTVIA